MAEHHQRESKSRDHDSFDDSECNVDVFSSFDAMPLHTNLLRGVYSYGYERPSAIQQRAIVPFIKGGDLIAQAQSGTGKTGAFTVGLLQRMDFSNKQPQALVMLPTRELAVQTEQVVSHIGDFLAEGYPQFCATFIGGTPVSDDMRKLQTGVIVAVGTPGRICDVIKRGGLRTEALKVLVLDEADVMLSEGFAPQIYDIFKYLPKDIQIGLFSATMPLSVLELAQKFMRHPTQILVKKEALTLMGIKQFYVAMNEGDKLDTLMDLYENVSVAQSVIFCNSRKKVTWLAEQMNQKQFTVSFIHADMGRGEREKVMAAFRKGSTRVLITTDLLSRGIDVQQVSIVINFDLPDTSEPYLHRIGRSGRYGRKGIAINFVTARDVKTLKDLQAFYDTQIDELPADFAQHLD